MKPIVFIGTILCVMYVRGDIFIGDDEFISYDFAPNPGLFYEDVPEESPLIVVLTPNRWRRAALPSQYYPTSYYPQRRPVIRYPHYPQVRPPQRYPFYPSQPAASGGWVGIQRQPAPSQELVPPPRVGPGAQVARHPSGHGVRGPLTGDPHKEQLSPGGTLALEPHKEAVKPHEEPPPVPVNQEVPNPSPE